MHYNKQVKSYSLSSNPVFKLYTIFLYGEENNRTPLVARLYFELDSKTSLTPHRVESGVPVISYYQWEWPRIVDLLRNENPLWFWAVISDDGNIANASLGTRGLEPVGEGEITNPNIV